MGNSTIFGFLILFSQLQTHLVLSSSGELANQRVVDSDCVVQGPLHVSGRVLLPSCRGGI